MIKYFWIRIESSLFIEKYCNQSLFKIFIRTLTCIILHILFRKNLNDFIQNRSFCRINIYSSKNALNMNWTVFLIILLYTNQIKYYQKINLNQITFPLNFVI